MDRSKVEKIIDICMLESFIASAKLIDTNHTLGDDLFDFFRLLVKNGCPLEAIMNALQEFNEENVDDE